MNHSSIVHEQREKRPNIFWWINIIVDYILGFILAALLIIGPFILLIQLKNFSAALLLVTVPIGLWILKWFLNKLGKRVWHGRHRSYFKLERNKLTYEESNIETRSLKKDTVSFESIQYIVSSLFILEDNHVFAASETGRISPLNIGSILYIVYLKDGHYQMTKVPFYPDERSINIWLETFQERSIPLYYTDLLLYNDSEKERLALFEDDDILVPYMYEQSWEEEIYSLKSKWEDRFEHVQS
ncbi:hypothetical protein [Halobacillus ihumii]|uniref:hypothetical protein n=1 Tax=Halobacillus ihumii TaxID=2686092 RepID=UPI0013D13354|nr:hypothetical protein [Halobacillus ihumii]